MLKVVGRVIWVPIAFGLAALVAGFVLVTLGSERLVQEVPDARIGGDGVTVVLGWIEQARLIGGLLSLLSLAPAVLLVVVGEVARIQSALYYVLGGGAALAVVPLLGQLGSSAALALPAPTVLQVLATAGFAAGLVYWLLAGRNA